MLKLRLFAIITALAALLTSPVTYGALFARPDCTVRLVGERAYFTGYASVFGVADLRGDVTLKGTFTKALAARMRPVRLLFKHGGDVNSTRPKEIFPDPIGQWTRITEDDYGLYVEGYLDLNVPAALKALKLIQKSRNAGLSIGFQPVEVRRSADGRFREIVEAELSEISVVDLPQHPLARLKVVRPESKP